MTGADLEVLQAAEGWLHAGRRVTLATVVRTFGSAPRPVGALLALSDDGRLAGSVSGGCVESDLSERMRAGPPDRPEHLRYGVTADEARRFGLPCGGTLELVLEPLRGAGDLAPLLQAIERRALIRRSLHLGTGGVTLAPATAGEAECRFDGHTLERTFGPVWRLLIIGAGQIGGHLADFAQALEYRVLVCEPREEYARSWRREGVELLGQMPDDAVRALGADARTVIVALTHDPRLDDLALMQALCSGAFYVGALGSRASQARRRERLLELGLGEAEVAKLHGPVGLPLGGKTPAEIALAVLAEVTALRHGVMLAPQPPAGAGVWV